MIGVNDIGRARNIDAIYQGITDIVKELSPAVTNITVSKILYTNGIKRDNDSIRKLNRKLNELEKLNVTIIDFNPELKHNFSSARKYTTDGIHLTDSAYKILKQKLVKQYHEDCKP